MFICLSCNTEIVLINKDNYYCSNCDKNYRALLGIPDLRIFSPPYLSIDDDWSHAQELVEHFNDYGFEGLLGYRYNYIPKNSNALI